MKKSIVTLAILGLLTASISAPVFADWKQETGGKRWWYENTDGSYSKSSWQAIDGKWYYFDAEGWMLSSTTTPDGYTVNENGQWVKDGVVQTADGASTTKTKIIKKYKRVKNVSRGEAMKSSAPTSGSISNEDFTAYQNSTNSGDEASISTEED